MQERRRRSLSERVGRGSLVPDERLRRADLSLEKRHDRSKRQKRWIVIGIIFLMLVGWRGLTPVKIGRITADDEQRVRTAAESHLHGISAINAFIDSETLAESVTADLESAVGAKVNHRFWLGKVDIEIRTQQPAVRWQTKGVQYIVSDFGVVLSQVGTEPPSLPVIFDESNVDVEVKTAIVPKDFIDFVVGLDAEAARRGTPIKEHYVNGSIRELKVVIEGLPYRLTMSTKRPSITQLDELSRLQAYFAAAGRGPSEYADLRIAGRAYWR